VSGLGWFLDAVVVFLSRTLLRLVRDRKTAEWPTVEGIIHTSARSGSAYPAAEITYMYSVNNEGYFGVHNRAFFFRDSADDYAKLFIPEWKLTVRYSAKDPQASFVSDHDQVTPPVWATRYR
jgi:hypothetical protein